MPGTGYRFDFVWFYGIYTILGYLMPNHWLPTGSISPCNRSLAAFSHVVPYNSRCIQEGQIPLVIQLNYFLLLFLQTTQDLSLAGWSCRQFAYVISFKQSSSTWSESFSPHFAHLCRPLLDSLWCPYFWHLKHLRGAGTYCSTHSR